MTIDDYAALPDDDLWRDELAGGLLVREPRPGARHGRVQTRLARYLDVWADENRLGAVFVESGFVLSDSPPTVRGPDASFVAGHRLPQAGDHPYPRLAPDLVVEVISPAERPAALRQKVADYLAAGVRLVWLVDPQRRSVTILRPSRERRTIGMGDGLDGEDVLPGFRLPLGTLLE
jgi:Uma2 family endonuclease